MKTKPTRLKVFLLALFLCCIGKLNFAQTSNNYIANDHLVSPTIYEWDVYLQATSTSFPLRSIQYGFFINPAFIPAGATITPSFDPTFSELVTQYSGGNPQWNVSNPAIPCISVPSMTAQNCSGAPASNLTTFSVAGGPKRIVRFRLTSSIPFPCVAPNLSMIRPNDAAPGGVLKCALSQWSATCVTTPIQANATYSTFSVLLGGPTLTNLIHNLNDISVSAASPATSQLCAGTGSQTFSVTGTGNGTLTPVSYQWMLDGLPLADGPNFQGTNTPNLVVTNPSSGGSLVCQVSQCSPTTGTPTSAPATLNVVQSTDNNACTTDACDPATGVVTHTPIDINDNNSCTADACDPSTGAITHTAVDVNDNNFCTTDACDPSTGAITHTAVNVSDNNVCTNDACDPATGNISHTPGDFNDNNPCTADGCDPASGPTHTQIDFSDANLCDVEACDPATGNISHTLINISDNNACTADACDPATGAVSHTQVDVNDNNSCTTDACNPSTGAITHTEVDINDNNACTSDACDPATGAITHTAIDINDNNACTADACNPATGAITHTAGNINDNNACTADACDPATGAVTHTPSNIDDLNGCTTDACDPATGAITHTAVNINDNNACTADACDPATGAITHTASNIDDNNACTADACDPSTGAITHTAANINDNNACTADACDPSTGAITHTASNTDDNNACTADACDPATGVISHTAGNINDNNACTADACDPSTGAVTHTATDVNDNNVCTMDACDPANGNISHTQISVDDHNACTMDGCDPFLGEYHNNVNPDDNNFCTIDFCDPLTGVHNDPLPNINDNDACTQDACDPTTGFVTHTPVNTDDNNLCTMDGCDPSTGVYHNSVPTDDFNPCTIDACDPATGNVTNTDATPVVSATTGTIACFGGSTSVTISAVGGQGSLSGLGTFSQSAGTTNYTVSDAAGCSVDYPVTLSAPTKITIDNISSTPTGCAGNTGTVSASATGGTGNLSYMWQPGNHAGANVGGLGAGTYTVTVTDQNGCTTTGSVAVTASGGGNPTPPGAISGSVLVCKGQCGLVYSVAPVPGALSYIWTLPAGMTGSSTGNSISICITSKFRGGFICVRVVNACGTSTATCLNVLKAKDKPATPSSIFGPNDICAGQTVTYMISAVPNTSSYVWTVNNGMQIMSGQGTTTITVKAPAGFTGGTVKVYAKNCKGNSGTKSKNVKNGIPGSPGSVNGPSSVCKSQTKAFSCGAASGATSYTWAVTGGATIFSGQGTTNVNIKFTTATLTTAVVSVVANGPCGSSAPKTRTVAVNLTCRTSADVTGSDMNPVTDLTAYPNPTSAKATVSFTVTENTKCMMRVMDMLGNVLISESISAVEGPNTKDLNMDRFAKGVYFISIQTENNDSQTLRIVVE